MTATLFVPKRNLFPSRSQPREELLELERLAAQIRAAGNRIERPIDVLAPNPKGHYELVDGHRRHAAALLIEEIEQVEVRVVAGTPAEIALRQLRANDGMALTPLEEGRAYQRLGREHELTVAEIADQVGRPIGYVRSRMLLAQLVPAAQALLADKRIGLASAALLAHLDEAVQSDAADTLVRLYPAGSISTLHVRHAIERHTHALARAPFPTSDETLTNSAGSCLTCACNTSTQRDLFEETDEAGICTSASCWDTKVLANVDRVTVTAAEMGVRVMDASEVAKTLDAGRVRPGARWVHVDTPIDPESGDALTWRELEQQLAEADRDGEGYATEHVALAFDAGRPVWLLDSEYAEQFIRQSYQRRAAQLRGEADPEVTAAKEERKERKKLAEDEAAQLAAEMEALAKGTRRAGAAASDAIARTLALLVAWLCGTATMRVVAQRRELPTEDERGRQISPYDQLGRHVADAEFVHAYEVIVELVATAAAHDEKIPPSLMKALYEAAGVDPKAIAKERKNAKRNVKTRARKGAKSAEAAL